MRAKSIVVIALFAKLVLMQLQFAGSYKPKIKEFVGRARDRDASNKFGMNSIV